MNGRRASGVQHKQSEGKEKEKELISEHKTLQEELIRATKMVEGGEYKTCCSYE